MRLFCRIYGSGPPLIILHGLFGSSDNWVSIAKKLSDTFTVCLPDQRNHGQSPHSEIHDYPSMTEDLLELAQRLRFTKFYLAGHSMGGKTAIHFAIRYPEMLNGLLVADISPFIGKEDNLSTYEEYRNILLSMINMKPESVRTRAEAEQILLETVPQAGTRGFILKNLQRTSGGGFSWKLNPGALLGNLDKIMEAFRREDATTLHVTGFPVIFIRGENSDYLPVSDFRDIRRLFPAAEFIDIHGAGHWVHADNPGEVVNALKRLTG